MKIEALAQIVHEANAAYCRTIGDNSQHSWEHTPTKIKLSAVDGVLAVVKNPEITPEQLHQNWFEFKHAEGWTFGTEKDMESKKHPCMVPYRDLPEEQRMKDELFRAIVSTFIEDIEYDETAAGKLLADVA